jgi:radical SAM superfamily enzyme YgiQ (UPF0313 family)
VRVLFIYPNLNAQIGFNYGVGYLSSFLKTHGHETGLLNINNKLGYDLDLDRILRDVKTFNPDLIGFSVVTNQYQATRKIASHLKKYVSVPLAVGGVHATMAPEETLKTGLFDFLCIGEGEQAMVELADSLENGGDFSKIRNIWHYESGEIYTNPVRPFISLEKIPPIDYTIFNFQRMIDAKGGWVGVMASRGCPFRCNYCFNHRIVDIYRHDTGVNIRDLHYLRQYPIEMVIDDLKRLLKTYRNIRIFIFDDDLFTMNREYVFEFCRQYKQAIDVPFVCNAHVRVFDEEIARSLSEAGCAIVKFGLESGSDRIRRKVLNRPMRNEDIIHAFKMADKYGIHTSAFVMIGLPHETIDDLKMTIKLLGAIKPGRFRWSIFFPFIGTKAYDIAKNGGFIDWKKMENLTNFTDESCLNFGAEQNLFIDKLAKAYPWFVNAEADFPSAPLFEKLTRMVLAMDRKHWLDIRDEIRAMDGDISEALITSGKRHYSIRFNPFMGVRDDWLERGEE